MTITEGTGVSLIEFTQAVDHDLRAYARWISPNDGEDAYHDAICDVLRLRKAETINNPAAFFRCAIKRALYKIFRHQRAERENTAAYLAGDPPPSSQALKLGRLPQDNCRRGHPLTEDNLTYVGARRTCKTCFRTRTAAAARLRRAQQKEMAHA